MGYNTYALDAAGYDRTGSRCWVPLEDDGTLVLGLNYISDLPPDECKAIAVFHEDGSDACDAWCDEHAEEIDAIKTAVEERSEEATA